MLSIVIPTMNEAAYLPTLLASMETQTLQPDEVIVADAGSTDETVEIARSFGARVVKGGMPGPGRNRGAEAAGGDILLFLDADVELRDSDFLNASIAEMQRRNLDLATCDVEPISEDKLDHVAHQAYNTFARACGSRFPHIPGFCMFVRREVHEQIGGFDESVVLCEDHEYAERACRAGATFGFLRSLPIPVSIRRLERDGRVNVALKYMLAEVHRATIGPIRHDYFRYSFGHNASRKQRSRLRLTRRGNHDA